MACSCSGTVSLPNQSAGGGLGEVFRCATLNGTVDVEAELDGA
jgi:hypothetical protein